MVDHQLYDSADDLADVDEHDFWSPREKLSLVSAVMKKSCIRNNSNIYNDCDEDVNRIIYRQTFDSTCGGVAGTVGRLSTIG